MIRILLVALLGWVAGSRHCDAWQDHQPFPSTLRAIAVPNQNLELNRPSQAVKLLNPSTADRSLYPVRSNPTYIVGSSTATIPAPFWGNPTNVYRKPEPRTKRQTNPNSSADPGSSTGEFDLDLPGPPPEMDGLAQESRRSGAQLTSEIEPLRIAATKAVNEAFGDVPRQTANSPASGQPLELGSRDDEQVQPLSGTMKIRVQAPSWMIANQSTEFKIEVLNLGSSASTPVDLELKVPAEFTITRFDLDATLDESTRTIRFRVESIPARYKQTISLRGISYVEGQRNLEIALSSQSRLLDRKSLAMGVLKNASGIRNATKPNSKR